jgi:RHS repeat-associated protein
LNKNRRVVSDNDEASHDYTYDAENHIKSVGADAAYVYDGEGQRVRKLLGENLRMVYGITGELLAEFDGAPVNKPLKKEYIYGASGLIATIAAGEGTRYLTADHLGSPRIITTASGGVVKRHDYEPFGEELFVGMGGRTTAQGYSSETDTLRQKFTGKERDHETGLDYFGARYYASVQGRFTSPDDFLNDTHINDPASWNLYVYVRNNPLRYIDPFGEEVYDTGLTGEDQRKLIDDLKNKTGYKDIQFIKGKLVINVKAGYEGGSEAFRTQLLDATTTREIRFELSSVNNNKVGFAQIDEGTIPADAKGKRTSDPVVYQVQIDSGDFKQLSGNTEAKDAFTIGIATLHEIAHKLYGENSDKPNSDTDPGPIENIYINPGRRQLGLAERVHYTAKEVFPKGTRQVLFNFKGKDKILRWQHDKVGGKPTD